MFELFGDFGAIIMAAIFTLACMTTCVGLTNSISVYFEKLFKKVSYTKWVIIITVASFLICNLGLNLILSISVPILNAIYPVAIVLIVLGLLGKYFGDQKIVYKLAIYTTAVISTVYAVDSLVDLGGISTVLSYLPLYDAGFGWLIPSALMTLVALAILIIKKAKRKI
jgi:LIVCS family branched-chain amino acid:cation transporter